MFYQQLKPFIKDLETRSIKLKRGQIIYHQGDEPKEIYLVDSGIIGLFHISETGKETFLRVFKKDSIFGHRSFFAESAYHATSVALTECEITIIPKEACDEICAKNPVLLKELTKQISRSLADAELRLSGLLDKSANKRIAESLIYFKLKYPEKVWTRKEIADFSGSTYETVTRVMTELNAQNLITKEGRDFSIIDTDSLLNYYS